MSGHSKPFLNAPLHPMITKEVPKWCSKTPQMPPKWCPRPIKISKFDAHLPETKSQFLWFVIANLFFLQGFQSCRSFKSCKSVQIANDKSAGWPEELMKSTCIATATLRTHRLHSLMAPGNLQILQILQACKSPVNWLPDGAGGRGEALRYIYIYIYISI